MGELNREIVNTFLKTSSFNQSRNKWPSEGNQNLVICMIRKNCGQLWDYEQHETSLSAASTIPIHLV